MLSVQPAALRRVAATIDEFSDALVGQSYSLTPAASAPVGSPTDVPSPSAFAEACDRLDRDLGERLTACSHRMRSWSRSVRDCADSYESADCYELADDYTPAGHGGRP